MKLLSSVSAREFVDEGEFWAVEELVGEALRITLFGVDGRGRMSELSVLWRTVCASSGTKLHESYIVGSVWLDDKGRAGGGPDEEWSPVLDIP